MSTRRRLLNKTIKSVSFTNVTSFSYNQSTTKPSPAFNILISYSDNSSEVKAESALTYTLNYYVNSGCTTAASGTWYNSPSTYYAKATVTINGKIYITTNYLTITIKSTSPNIVDYKWTVSCLNDYLQSNYSRVTLNPNNESILQAIKDNGTTEDASNIIGFDYGLWVYAIAPWYYDDYAYGYGYGYGYGYSDLPVMEHMMCCYASFSQEYNNPSWNAADNTYYFIRYFNAPSTEDPEQSKFMETGGSSSRSSNLIPCKLVTTGNNRYVWETRA